MVKVDVTKAFSRDYPDWIVYQGKHALVGLNEKLHAATQGKDMYDLEKSIREIQDFYASQSDAATEQP